MEVRFKFKAKLFMIVPVIFLGTSLKSYADGLICRVTPDLKHVNSSKLILEPTNRLEFVDNGKVIVKYINDYLEKGTCVSKKQSKCEILKLSENKFCFKVNDVLVTEFSDISYNRYKESLEQLQDADLCNPDGPMVRNGAIIRNALHENLNKLSKDLYGDLTSEKWSRAKLIASLAVATSNQASVQSDKFNLFLFFVVNSFVNELTSEKVLNKYKPAFQEAQKDLESSGQKSIAQIEPNDKLINFAIDITAKVLQTLKSETSDQASIEFISNFLIQLSEIKSLSNYNDKAFGFQNFITSNDMHNFLLTTDLGIETRPETKMILAIIQWLSSNFKK